MTTTFKKTQRHLYQFITGYYNILLLLLIFLFVFRPYGDSLFYLGFWKLLLTCTLISVIFNAHHKKYIMVTAIIIAIPSVILSWINLIHQNEHIFVTNAVLTVIFMSICTSSILYHVLAQARVTIETLKGVICAYFMVAFLFAYIFYLIDFIDPGSFTINSQIEIFSFTRYLSEMLYFSFITLLTIGYGDIIAVKQMGQTGAVIEGIIGQFYIAILVARIVSVYSIYSDKRLLKTIEEDLAKLKIKKSE